MRLSALDEVVVPQGVGHPEVARGSEPRPVRRPPRPARGSAPRVDAALRPSAPPIGRPSRALTEG